jgi:hypothetical protein
MVQVVQTPSTYALPSGLTKVAPVARRRQMGRHARLHADQRLKTLAPNQQRIADEIGGSARQLLALRDAGRKACPK